MTCIVLTLHNVLKPGYAEIGKYRMDLQILGFHLTYSVPHEESKKCVS